MCSYIHHIYAILTTCTKYWRLLSQHLACTNSSVLLLMELILYNASVNVERQFGSVKFAVRPLLSGHPKPSLILWHLKSFITVSTLLSSTLSFITLLALHRLGINHLPAGPTSIIFSILYQYYRLVPSAYTFQIFALKFSNKSFLYVLALQASI
jgi:ubiquitin-associated domain-containing protein 2